MSTANAALTGDGSPRSRGLMPTSFTVTAEHLALLPRMYLQWDSSAYDGAPAVGLKRPYGNSDVFGDVAEACGLWTMDPDLEDEMPADVLARCELIHQEMVVVLQILVQNPGGIVPGEYRNVAPWAPYGTMYRLDRPFVADGDVIDGEIVEDDAAPLELGAGQ